MVSSRHVRVALLAHAGQGKVLEVRDALQAAIDRSRGLPPEESRAKLASELDGVLLRLFDLEILLREIEEKAPPAVDPTRSASHISDPSFDSEAVAVGASP
jgi:hypothetical protein